MGSHVQAGLLAFNVGDRRRARRYFAVARGVTDEAGDDTLRAQALGATSYLPSPVPTGVGDARRALALTRQAAVHARRGDPGTQACVYRWLAEELSADGDECGFFKAMEVVERLAQGEGGNGRGFFAHCAVGVRHELVRQTRGVGLLRLGRVEESVKVLRVLLESGLRQTAIALTEIAAARVLQGEPEEACAGLIHAIDVAIDAGYRMGVERILGVRARFPATWAGLPCVQELDERLRLLTT